MVEFSWGGLNIKDLKGIFVPLKILSYIKIMTIFIVEKNLLRTYPHTCKLIWNNLLDMLD